MATDVAIGQSPSSHSNFSLMQSRNVASNLIPFSIVGSPGCALSIQSKYSKPTNSSDGVKGMSRNKMPIRSENIVFVKVFEKLETPFASLSVMPRNKLVGTVLAEQQMTRPNMRSSSRIVLRNARIGRQSK